MTMTIHPQVIITAHRGASGYAPENTMSSLKKAIEMGAEFCEIDVQETSDGILVLIHDSNYKRTCGVNKNVWEVRYEETKTFDCGKWFSEEFRYERIPTLEQIIESARGKIKLNIELKTNGHEKLLAERVVEIVIKKNFSDNVIITSFDFNIIDKVKKNNPIIKAGYIFSGFSLIDVFSADIDVLSVNKAVVDEDFVKKSRQYGKEVHVWTVNDAEDMKKLVDLGVSSIITNYPDRLKNILQNK